MFASWSSARGALLAAAAAATFGVLAAQPASALEGIQGRHAIFYPSLELIYQHDDNYFLLPSDEVSADTFIAKAHFVLEVPGARQYLRMEYAPQWRNVSVNAPNFDLDEQSSHFWELDAKLKGSAIFGVDIAQNFTRGSLEVYELDRSGSDPGSIGREFVSGAGEPFVSHNIDVDFKWGGSRQGAQVTVGKTDNSFEDTDQAPIWFELDEWRLGTEYHYKFTPLTAFLVGFQHASATEDFTDKLSGETDNPLTPEDETFFSMDSSRNHLYFGFDGELGRTTTGLARLGFKSLDFDNDRGGTGDWDGVVLRANVTKSFSRWTKLAFGAERNVHYSAYFQNGNVNPYYVANQVAFTLSNQPQGSRVGWTLIGQFHRNGYDTPTANADGILVEREDDITRLRAEVGFHPIEHLSFRLNYQFEERESNIPEFEYDDNLVIFQVQFGF